jgi:gluconolactonase
VAVRPLLALLLVLPAIPPAISAAETIVADDTAAFAQVVDTKAELRKLQSGFGFVEGPIWCNDDGDGGGCVIFSDIPGQELLRWREGHAAELLGSVRKAHGSSNGNTLAHLGGRLKLVTCSHTLHALLTGADGDFTDCLVDSYQGKELSSPNDLAVAADGAIWFTDPIWGLGKRQRQQEKNRVYRFVPETKELTAVIEDLDQPNGICFSPDGATLYVADSGKPHRVMAWEVQPDAKLANEREVAVIDPGVPDGMKCDSAGRLYVAAGDGIHVFAQDAGKDRRIGRILVPETPANLCFGGPDGKTLFITARTSLYAITVEVVGKR